MGGIGLTSGRLRIRKQPLGRLRRVLIDIEIQEKHNKEKVEENNTPKSFLEWIKASEAKEIRPELNPKQKERIEFKERDEELINQFIN